MFNNERKIDIYLYDTEKAMRLTDEIIALLKAEHVSLSQTRSLFSYIVNKIEDTPM